MNKRVDQLPPESDNSYAVVSPRWFTLILQAVSLLFSLVCLWIAYTYWAEMPIWVKGLLLILIPGFVFVGLHPQGWRSFSSRPFLFATPEGLYFPEEQQVELGKKMPAQRYLFIPWQHIGNVRVGKVTTSDGESNGAIFDVKASKEEITTFLHYAEPVDKQTHNANWHAVAFYCHSIPSAKTVVAQLNAMRP